MFAMIIIFFYFSRADTNTHTLTRIHKYDYMNNHYNDKKLKRIAWRTLNQGKREPAAPEAEVARVAVEVNELIIRIVPILRIISPPPINKQTKKQKKAACGGGELNCHYCYYYCHY